MAEYATKSEVENIVNKAIDKAVADLSEIITTFAQQVDTRFNTVEKELFDLRESHHRLLNTIDGFIGRIDHYEIEQAARDSQFNRLLEWARKVSEKTGIPLEDF